MSHLQDVFTQKSFQYLYEVETIGQDILTAKQTKLELSNARNKYREALRALEKVEERKTWMEIGSVYVQRPTKECIEILRKEMDNADTDINNLEDEIREKIHKLRDLEHEPRLEGFGLKPLSSVEAKALYKGLGLD